MPVPAANAQGRRSWFVVAAMTILSLCLVVSILCLEAVRLLWVVVVVARSLAGSTSVQKLMAVQQKQLLTLEAEVRSSVSK